MTDPLDGDWDPAAYWSTSNVGEPSPAFQTYQTRTDREFPVFFLAPRS